MLRQQAKKNFLSTNGMSWYILFEKSLLDITAGQKVMFIDPKNEQLL